MKQWFKIFLQRWRERRFIKLVAKEFALITGNTIKNHMGDAEMAVEGFCILEECQVGDDGYDWGRQGARILACEDIPFWEKV